MEIPGDLNSGEKQGQAVRQAQGPLGAEAVEGLGCVWLLVTGAQRGPAQPRPPMHIPEPYLKSKMKA